MPTLREVYDNPKTTTRDPARLAKLAGTRVKSARAFLTKQGGVQVSKERRKPDDSEFAPTGGPRGEYLCDLVFLLEFAGVNAKRASILTLMEVNSRYVYARGLTAPHSSKKTAEALADILEENGEDKGVAPILSIRTDGGTEFSGAFAALAAKYRITVTKGEPGTHERLGRIDRFHGTLRTLIGQQFASTGSHKWYNVLPALIENYNTRPHRTLSEAFGRHTAPADVTPRMEEALRALDLRRAAALRARVDDAGVRAGTRVRLLVERQRGSKGTALGRKKNQAVWSSQIYRIVERAGPNSFLVDVPAGENTVWPLHALQIVKGRVHTPSEGEKVDPDVVRARRMEARNISEEEQEAALKGPSNSKRVVKPTPKAAALMETTRPRRVIKPPARYR